MAKYLTDDVNKFYENAERLQRFMCRSKANAIREKKTDEKRSRRWDFKKHFSEEFYD